MLENEHSWIDDFFEEVIKESRLKRSLPGIGDVVYIPSESYEDRECLSFQGGKAVVYKIREVKNLPSERLLYVRTPEYELAAYSWGYLKDLQPELEDRFGDNWALTF